MATPAPSDCSQNGIPSHTAPTAQISGRSGQTNRTSQNPLSDTSLHTPSTVPVSVFAIAVPYRHYPHSARSPARTRIPARHSLSDECCHLQMALRAAKKAALHQGCPLMLCGTELDPEALRLAQKSGLTKADLANVQIRDFALNPPDKQYPAIVGNPAYIRHHRLSVEAKCQLKAFSATLLGKPLDGRAGLHLYFFCRHCSILKRAADWHSSCLLTAAKENPRCCSGTGLRSIFALTP